VDYTTPRDLTANPLTAALRLVPGEGAVAAKAIDPALLGEDIVDVQEAVQAFRGCGGAGRLTVLASGAAYMTVTVAAGFLDAEMRIQVNDGAGGHVWEVQADADDQFTINDAGMIYGVPVANYAGIAIASLYLEVIGSTNHRRMVGAAGIALSDAPGGFTGDDMPRSAADPTVVDAAITEVENNFAVEHEMDGTHTPNFLLNAYLSPDDVLDGEGVQNILFGQMEDWPAGINAPPKGWVLYGAPTSVVRSTTAKYGAYSALITAGGAARGIYYPVPNYDDYKTRTISVSAWVLTGGVAGDVQMTLDDGVAPITGTAVAVTGAWQLVRAQITLAADATRLYVIIASAAASSPAFYLDGVMGVVGRLYKAFEKPIAANLDIEEVVPVNLLLNAGFEQWHNGFSHLPDLWEQYGGGIVSFQKGAGANKWGKGYLLIGSDIGVGMGIKQRIIFAEVLNSVKDRYVTLSAWLKLDGGTSRQFTVGIMDDLGSTTQTYQISTFATWQRIWVTHLVNAAATTLEVQIYTADAGVNVAVIAIDSICLNVGSSPVSDIGAAVPSAWVPMNYHFGTTGEVSLYPVYMEHGCAPTGTFLPSAMTLSASAGPTSVQGAQSLTATLYAYANTIAPETRTIAVIMPAPGEAVNWPVIEKAVAGPGSIVPVSPGEVMLVSLTISGGLQSNPNNLYATVHGYVWAGV